MYPSNSTIAIIGGGPVGLVSSILLSLHNIEHVLFERQPGTSIHPKAVGLNQRTIEIFRKIGVEAEVLRQSAPVEESQSTAWCTSLGPNGREIARRHAWGGGPYAEAYERASPCRYALLPQIRLEPVLRKRAEELNPKGIFYHSEVTAVEERDEEVILAVHHRGSQNTFSVSATQVLGCDGGRFLSDALGICCAGETNIIDMVSAHFHADLSSQCDTSNFITWFISPEFGSIKTGYLYPVGPYPMRSGTEEWMFACARLPYEQVQPFTEADMLDRLHQTLRIPHLEIELISMSHWYVNAKVSERYRSLGGRVFLLGDAAHRVPPWGALGLNSGIQDVDNLIWKLALALKHPKVRFDGLLQTYNSERRPVAERVALVSLHNMRSHALVLDEALGIRSTQTAADNVSAMEQYFDLDNTLEGQQKRQAVAKALNTLDVEFYAHAAEVGWFYDTDTVQPSPQRRPDGKMELCEYRPTTLPGHQLPHAWLSNQSGECKSTRELLARDRLVLLAGSPDWLACQNEFVVVQVINDGGDHWQDRDGRWAAQREVDPSGAVLVRPDGIVASRFKDNSIVKHTDVRSEFNHIVRQVLKI